MNAIPGIIGPLTANLNLAAQLLMGAALLAGMWLARRKRFRAHARCQSAVVLLNLIPITIYMLPVFRRGVMPAVPAGRRISFSMGVAEALGENDTLDEMIHRADQALYRAKQNGRDRCESAPPVRLAASTVVARPPIAAREEASPR